MTAHADFTQEGFSVESILNARGGKEKGWAIGPQVGRAHSVVLLPEGPVALPAGATLTVTIEQLSPKKHHTLAAFRLAATVDPRAAEITRTPAPVLAAIKDAVVSGELDNAISAVISTRKVTKTRSVK